MAAGYKKLMAKIGVVKPKGREIDAAVKMSLIETVGRAAMTATVTFVVGLILKRTFEKIGDKQISPALPKVKPSSHGHSPSTSYRKPERRNPNQDVASS